MSEPAAPKRLSKVASEFGVGINTLMEFLNKMGVPGVNPNFKVEADHYEMLLKEYGKEKAVADAAHKQLEESRARREAYATNSDPNVDSTKKPAPATPTASVAPAPTPAPAPAPAPEPPPAPPAPVVEASKPVEIPEVAPEPVVEEKPEPPAPAPTPEPVVEPEPVVAATPAPEPTPESETIKAKIGEDMAPKFVVKGKIELPVKGKAKSKEEVKPQPKVETPPPAPTPKPEPVAVTPETPVAEEKHVTSVADFIQLTEEEKQEKVEPEHHQTQFQKLEGPKIMGKMELPVDDKKKSGGNQQNQDNNRKEKRKRIRKGVDVNSVAQSNQGGGGNQQPNQQRSQQGGGGQQGNNQGNRNNNQRNQHRNEPKPALTEEEIQKQIKETLARLSAGGKSKSSKYRREKRDEKRAEFEAEMEQQEMEKKIIKVTEFVTANELAKMMNVPVNKIISTCMALGMFVSINQRLDAETLSIVAEEFGYAVEFVSAEVQEAIKEDNDTPDDLKPRPPIVTVMGHVDHGKTSLLDYIRKANVIAGEAGGITQHIGAYSVELESGKHITFLDTPGHEAFTAMRARGAKVTDVVIVVVAADDNVMPQTREAINHAQAAGVPIVFAINKIDKPGANPDKIREELAAMNILVEDWGGKYQCQEISAKKGINIDLLLEKVLLEAEMLDLKANPSRNAAGTVIESSLDKGRGFISTILVEKGTLRVGDVILAGCYSGRVKAMQNERNQNVKSVGPATPAIILGLTGAPQAGDHFNVMDDEREARDIANKRLQLQREQGYRTKKHITLDEIGRRLAIGDFQELNIIVKGDVDGSVEALSDSLIKLSTEKIQVNIVHKAVGQISESDVMLASASNAIVVGFQVRPSVSARKIAEQEQIDIRLYSIIYNAIEEVKAAMEGMLAPTMEEKVVGNIEVREVFKISKVGTVAGCYVLDGKVNRQTRIRLIRDGIVVYNGNLGSLKRFKDDVKEVLAGYECGLNIENFNDIKVGDIIEGYTEVEVKQKL
ncbi:MAG: translation initiation factor IF-2 [Bacteroidia bacterium]|nr:translation initiation factor IF-2 [Bacteroidia bacterium]